MGSSPKLSLSKLRRKPREPLELQTPTLESLVSIPFHWEEAPGKPRTTATIPSPPPNDKTARRCLDLPPRLLNDAAKITNTPSPTTVLDGAYLGPSVSRTLSFSFRKVWHGGSEERSKKGGSGVKERLSFGSWRWESFEEDTKVVRDNFDISVGVNNACEPEISRRSSFLTFSSKKSLWVSVKNLFHRIV